MLKRATTLALDWDARQKVAFEATDSAGRSLCICLPSGTLLRDGDVLVGDDGSLIKILAALQPVLVITACNQHGSASDLARAAYHLGKRHVATDFESMQLKIQPDPALMDMLRALHVTVSESVEAFEPETSAHATPAVQPANQPKSVIPITATTPHVHGPGCGHHHGPGHSH